MNKKPLSYLGSVIGSLFAHVLGRFNWSSPPWLGFLRHKAASRPKQFWSITGAVFLVFSSLGYGYYWCKNLPQPQLITASISALKITPLVEEEALVPDNLTIDFGFKDEVGNFTTQSVAPLQLIGKKVPKGIELSPTMPGEWEWQSDRRLVFTPEQDWPAGQTYSIHFSKDIFVDTAKMAGFDYHFSTQPFQASIAEFKFYQDPTDPKTRQAIATINFNFPVDPTSFESKTSLMLESLKKDQLDLAAQQFKFTVTYDKYKRVAYLHSETLLLPEVSHYLLLTVAKGVESITSSAKTGDLVSQNLLIPDISSYFKVSAASASIIRNEQDRPEQVLILETTLGVTDTEINKSLHVYLLPQDYPATAVEEEKKNYEWQNPGEVTANILTLSTVLPMQAIPTDRNYATVHSYQFNTQTPRYIYLKLDKGVRAFGDFVLSNDYVAIMKVPEYPKEIGFLHKGALLALSSEKQLSVTIRGLPAAKFSIARILPDNVNQLVTQTQGDFNNPYFINQSFNQQNISEIFSEVRQFDASDLTKQQYTALDLTKYLSTKMNTGGPQGLFLLQATGWDVEQQQPLDVKTSRLVLITDLGLVVKDNNDGSHDVFVQSITQGVPVANANVTVLGKNGLPILMRVADTQGRVNFPALKDFIDDREPAVYLASFGSDVSFIPYNNNSRQLNYSRYDIGGVYNNNQELHSLSAYLFSDRGIYRPGDQVHLGMIVKQRYAQPQPAGLLLEATIIDPRGTTIHSQKLTLDESGYLSLDFQTNTTSPTGQYLINLYIVKDKHADSLLGSTTVRVAEFLPDRMRISSHLSQEQVPGWISPSGLKATVDLWNLYGAPAVDRKIVAKILLTPQRVQFDKYPDYVFADPLFNPNKPPKIFTDNLADVSTDDKGQAQFDLNLERFDKATYQLMFFAEGFEAEGGRSVTTQSTALVSPLPYFIGYKPDGDLAYIKQNSQRSVNLIAVNPQLNQQAVSRLKIQLVALHPVSTLVKKTDGTYQYQSILQTTVVSTKPFTVDEHGNNYALPTEKIGDFAVNILDQDNTELSHFKFSIVGASQLPLAKNAELNVKLNKEEYKADEEIELQITAPYTGAGLITIERDKVYAVQWFKADTTSSIQKIRIPNDFQGNGYVNVAFVRDWNSPDIFLSPLSYSVIPFTVDHESHAVHIELNTPALARPNEPFTIDYKSDKPGKIIVFAVDEGILQVSKYQTPDPLAFFFQKRALEVITQQTVDQILPKFVMDRELSAVGGDGSEELLASNLNPFKRKTDLPVVYWSGIKDTDSTTRQLVYQVPDYFNGTLRVMAVAVTNDAVGATNKKSEIRGNFVINPNTPPFVAPGDEFEITASIANNIKDSGADTEVGVQLKVTSGLEIVGSVNEALVISEGQEKTVRFKLRAKHSLGSAKITLIANANKKVSSMDATLSVRPASNFTISLMSGRSQDAHKSLTIDRSLYPEYRHVEAAISSNPLILVLGLQRYLDNFPYGCTEQLTSKAMPLLAMKGQAWFAKDIQVISEKILATMQMLGQRQMSSGAFSYWPGLGENDSNSFVSVYAMHFLTEAREQGYNLPNDLFSAGLAYLKDLAAQNVTTLDAARIQAYAVYILTRNELITTNYLTNLQLYLEQNQKDVWRQDIVSAYIAATYQLLKSTSEAERLINGYKVQATVSNTSSFYDKNSVDAQYLYLVARHFPEHLPTLGNKLVEPLVIAMNSDEINTILSSYTSLALAAYGQSNQISANAALSVNETFNDNQQKTLTALDNAYQTVNIDEQVKQITFNNPSKQTYFYQLSQAGFDKKLPTEGLKQGLDIYREYRDLEGKVITNTILGTDIEVHIQVRALNDRYLSNVVVVDLLPGGFEVVRDSVSNNNVDYTDIREDRVVFFMNVDQNAKELVYRIKAINTGTYKVPSIFAESMYVPTIKAHGIAGGSMSVINKLGSGLKS